jgi:hypothetical protein
VRRPELLIELVVGESRYFILGFMSVSGCQIECNGACDGRANELIANVITHRTSPVKWVKVRAVRLIGSI